MDQAEEANQATSTSTTTTVEHQFDNSNDETSNESTFSSTSNNHNHNHTDNDKRRNHIRRLLYAAQWCAELSEWITQFCIYVWLDAIGPSNSANSLFLASAYQLTSQVLVLLLVPRLTTGSGGRKRCRFMSRIVVGQNTCIIVMAICFSWVLNPNLSTTDNNEDENENGDTGDAESAAHERPMWMVVMVIMFLVGGVGEVLHQSYLVVIERDWIVAIADSDEVWLRQTTVFLKQIHLVCVILGPLFTGQIIDTDKARFGIEWVVGVKLVSLVVEYGCLKKAHSIQLPILNSNSNSSGDNSNLAVNVHNRTDDSSGVLFFPEETTTTTKKCSVICSYRDDLRVYASQSMAWAGLGYGLLYCNVLTFGGIMTTFLKSCGIPWSTIGVLQGISNLMGLLGTLAFSLSQRYMTLESSALCSIWWQFTFLTLAMSSIFVGTSYSGNNSDTNTNEGDSWSLSTNLIIAGVIPSRIGLWAHITSIIQLFQNTVPTDLRGRVGGTQTSINSFFDLLLFVLCMLFSDVQDFWILMMGGYTFVGLAAVLFFVKVYLPYKQRQQQQQQPRSASYEPTRQSEHELVNIEHHVPKIS